MLKLSIILIFTECSLLSSQIVKVLHFESTSRQYLTERKSKIFILKIWIR